MARVVQMSTLPATMPALPGYDVYGTFKPAELTGGDTFDLAVLDQGLLVVLGDATGHGIAPGAFGHADAGDAAHGVSPGRRPRNGVHASEQPARRDAGRRPLHHGVHRPARRDAHRLRFHSGGQAPILHFQAALGSCARHKPTSFPLAAMPLSAAAPGGDPRDASGRHPACFSRTASTSTTTPPASSSARRGSRTSFAAHHGASMAELSATLLDAVQAFAAGAPQDDDMTVVLVKREAARPAIIARSSAASTRSRLSSRSPRTSSPGRASTPSSCRSSIWRWRSCSRTWSNTAP